MTAFRLGWFELAYILLDGAQSLYLGHSCLASNINLLHLYPNFHAGLDYTFNSTEIVRLVYDKKNEVDQLVNRRSRNMLSTKKLLI